MDMARASSCEMTASIGGKPRKLKRLSRRQFAELISEMPVKDDHKPFISCFEVHRWASTIDGSIAVLAKSSGESKQDVKGWGSIIQLATAAGVVTGESLISGEVPDDEGNSDLEGEQRPDPTTETTSQKPH